MQRRAFVSRLFVWSKSSFPQILGKSEYYCLYLLATICLCSLISAKSSSYISSKGLTESSSMMKSGSSGSISLSFLSFPISSISFNRYSENLLLDKSPLEYESQYLYCSLFASLACSQLKQFC